MQVQSYKSRVLFKGACSAIPEDAVLLEVGPHAIMRAPLRQNCAALPYVHTHEEGRGRYAQPARGCGGALAQGRRAQVERP